MREIGRRTNVVLARQDLGGAHKGRPIVFRALRSLGGDHPSPGHHRGPARQYVPHGAVEQQIPDRRLVAGPVQTGGQVHERAELIDVERQPPVRHPQLLVAPALLEGRRRGNRKRLQKVGLRPGQVRMRFTQQQHAAESVPGAQEGRRRRLGIAHELAEGLRRRVFFRRFATRPQDERVRQAFRRFQLKLLPAGFPGPPPAGRAQDPLLIGRQQARPAGAGLAERHQNDQGSHLGRVQPLERRRAEVGQGQEFRHPPLQPGVHASNVLREQLLVARAGRGRRLRRGRADGARGHVRPALGFCAHGIRTPTRSRASWNAGGCARAPNSRHPPPIPHGRRGP